MLQLTFFFTLNEKYLSTKRLSIRTQTYFMNISGDLEFLSNMKRSE